jgi:O-antigen/teichoic acid export membrane protein
MDPRVEQAPRRWGSTGLRRLATSPITIRTTVFTGAEVVTTGLGGVATLLLARNLSTSQFGAYSFAISALAFGAMFFEFGLFIAPARQLARDRGHPGEIVAATTAAYLPVGLAFATLVFATSFEVNGWFHVDAGLALRLVAPLTFVFPYEFVVFRVAQGLDRVRLYSLTRTGAKAATVAALAGLLLSSRRLDVGSVLSIELSAMLLAWSAFTVMLRPAYRNVRARLQSFVREAREYGFQAYVGRVLSVGTYNMDTLMVAALTDARSVAFYALASAIAYPVALPGAGLAAALFPRMAKEPRLDRTWLLGAGALALLAAGLACILVRPFLNLTVGAAYLPVASILPPLALASAARSVTSIYNTHLTAHARGAELRNASLALTLSNLALNFGLIPPFGAIGAAWASLLALLCNLAMLMAMYRRVVRVLTREPLP